MYIERRDTAGVGQIVNICASLRNIMCIMVTQYLVIDLGDCKIFFIQETVQIYLLSSSDISIE